MPLGVEVDRLLEEGFGVAHSHAGLAEEQVGRPKLRGVNEGLGKGRVLPPNGPCNSPGSDSPSIAGLNEIVSQKCQP